MFWACGFYHHVSGPDNFEIFKNSNVWFDPGGFQLVHARVSACVALGNRQILKCFFHCVNVRLFSGPSIEKIKIKQ